MRSNEDEDVKDEKVAALVDILNSHGCSVDHLKLSIVPGAGRGLVAVKQIRPNSHILRLTEEVLITSTTVLNGAIGSAIARFPGLLNASDALCIFLMAESVLAKSSPWRPFIDTLPDDANVAALAFAVDRDRQDETAALLPPRCRSKLEEQLREIDACRRRVLKVWSEAKRLLGGGSASNCSKLDSNGSDDIDDDDRLFRWAWSCVNSRCIYKLNPNPSPLLNNVEPDAVALAPFLDMLNHSANTMVDCGFCSRTRTFEVFTQGGVGEGQEAMICYGMHTNGVLLLEYGFILDENPNNAVYLERDALKRICAKMGLAIGENHWKVLAESNLVCPLYETDPEPPWTFMATMKLLTMKEDELSSWHKIYDLASFDGETDVFKMALAIIGEYLAELKAARPQPDALDLLPKRFHSMIIRVWQDDISILSDAYNYVDELLKDAAETLNSDK